MTKRRVSRREAIATGLAGAGAGAAGWLGAGCGPSEPGSPEAPAGAAESGAGRGVHAAVVGAGAFGGWTALQLRRQGARVTLLDAWGPGNSRASSGGETRVIRATYGPYRIYTEMVLRALELWKAHERAFGERLFFRTGAVWMSAGEDRYAKDAVPILRELGRRLRGMERRTTGPPVPPDQSRRHRLRPPRRRRRLPARPAGLPGGAGRLPRRRGRVPPGGGGRRGDFRRPDAGAAARRRGAGRGRSLRVRRRPLALPPLPRLRSAAGATDPAGDPLLRRPAGPPRPHRPRAAGLGRDRGAPLLRHPGQQLPGLQGRRRRPRRPLRPHRGATGPPPRKRSGRRGPTWSTASPPSAARRWSRRGSASTKQSADGHLIVDTHPEAANVWIAGGGSGHGYKLGPALGEMLAGQALGTREKEPFFGLARFEEDRSGENESDEDRQ